MKKFVIWVVAFLVVSPVIGNVEEPEILCLSPQRCGTHWSLFIMCQILGREAIANRGVAEKVMFKEVFQDNEKKIYHGHNAKDLFIKKNGFNNDILVLIIRNYRECLYRDNQDVASLMNSIAHQASYKWIQEQKQLLYVQPHNYYFFNLMAYDSWHPDKRLMIRYEDLIRDPVAIADKVLTFFKQENKEEILAELEEHLEEYREQCLKIYEGQGGSKTRGKDPLAYTKKMGTRKAMLLDNCVKKHFPELFDKYLKQYELKKN